MRFPQHHGQQDLFPALLVLLNQKIRTRSADESSPPLNFEKVRKTYE